MKYLFINGRFPQYSQTFVHDQIKAIKNEPNTKITVFGRSKAPFRFENTVPECDKKLLYAKPLNKVVARRIAVTSLIHPVRALKLVTLKLAKKINLQTFLLGLQLRDQPDVSITHFGNNQDISTELKKYIYPKMKNVIVFHGHDVSSFIRKNGWEQYKNASPMIDTAICVNKIWAEQLRKNTSIADIRTVYLGTQILKMKRRRNGDEQSYSILFVGRFVEKKGIDILYSAIKELRLMAKTKIRVHCIGDGPKFADYKKKVHAEGLAETFLFYGSRQKSFVQKLMTECDIIVVPSKVASDGDSEGLPVVLMEAMVAGIPIISTYHSGIPELIEHQKTGLLVAENNHVQLRDMIDYAINNKPKMEELAIAAYDHVSRFHDEDKQVSEFVNAIKELK